MMIALLAILPMLLEAQDGIARMVEKRPDPSAPLSRYSETSFAHSRKVRAADPAIAAMVSEVNADTLRATLQDLQNMGSRFLLNIQNNKQIATILMNRFLSYGYTDVRLDSFYLIITNWGGMYDSTWQYNVVCTLEGSSAPQEIYVVGGHWDSFCQPDPFTNAPGVDDNGTAVAATLEIARVMKKMNYHPETTIRFTLFAAEELGLFGSRVAASKARFGGEDVRYMLNMDMISNNPADVPEVKVYQYLGFEWAGFCAADALERYTGLTAVYPQDKMNDGSDSYPYWLQAFPSAYFEEIEFSPNWHLPSDTLGNCNVPYLAEVTGGALATLAEQQRSPYPQNLRAQSTRQDIILHWKPTANAFIRGVNIYRSVSTGGPYQKISHTPVSDSTYHDVTAVENSQYYYVIHTVNDSLQESLPSDEVSGARFSFSDTLLVLANLKGSKTTPDSIRGFYHAILDTIPYRWQDINADQKINMSLVSRYRSILWMSNSQEFEPMNTEMEQCVMAHKENGGNILFAGFTPARFWMTTSINYPSKVPETALFRQLFKVDSNDRKVQSMLFRANAVKDYDTLHVDSLKFMDKQYIGQIYNVDVFAPAPEGTVIYRFDSRYDPPNPLGKMKNRPVGLEYMGNDHKSILLSFPLYYLDTADARGFMHYVVTEKFSYPLGVKHPIDPDPLDLHLYPNPVQEVCNVDFNLPKPAPVRISVVSASGQVISVWLDRKLDAGTQLLRFSTKSLVPGLYHVTLQTGNLELHRKIIRQPD